MNNERLQDRLSQVTTMWTIVLQANEKEASADAQDARRQVIHRYGSAVHRYLLGALRDRDAADEVFQDFAMRLLQGRICGAERERGRFRDFVKGVLFHMIADFQRVRNKERARISSEAHEPFAGDSGLAEAEREFVRIWRDELLAQCWEELRRYERESGRPYYTVLRYRTDHPGVPSMRMASQLQQQLDRPLSSAGVRQILHRARERFSDELLERVVHSLPNPSAQALEEELIALDVFDYCASALQRWSKRR
jgi:RNA polymerase sigma-70 factor (ECF subfamily)